MAMYPDGFYTGEHWNPIHDYTGASGQAEYVNAIQLNEAMGGISSGATGRSGHLLMIERVLGTYPAGAYDTVRERFEAIEGGANDVIGHSVTGITGDFGGLNVGADGAFGGDISFDEAYGLMVTGVTGVFGGLSVLADADVTGDISADEITALVVTGVTAEFGTLNVSGDLAVTGDITADEITCLSITGVSCECGNIVGSVVLGMPAGVSGKISQGLGYMALNTTDNLFEVSDGTNIFYVPMIQGDAH